MSPRQQAKQLIPSDYIPKGIYFPTHNFSKIDSAYARELLHCCCCCCFCHPRVNSYPSDLQLPLSR